MWQSQLRGPARVLAVALLGTSLFSGIACAAPAKGPSSRAAQALAAREYTPDDATDKEKVQDWMVDADIDEEKLVFYTGPRGEEMAKNFVSANSDYRYYSTVFDETFISDFGDVNTANEDVALALSEALAEYASGIVRVFNHDPPEGNGYYWQIELETLQDNDDVEWIYDMHDDATDPDDYGDVLKGLEEDD